MSGSRSQQSSKQTAGSNTIRTGATRYLGLSLFPDGVNACNVVVKDGTTEIDSVRAPILESKHVTANIVCSTDLNVVLTGTGSIVFVKFAQSAGT